MAISAITSDRSREAAEPADGGDEGGNQWQSAPSPQIEVARQQSPRMEVAQVYLWGLWGNGAVVSTCMLFEPMEVT